jgi:hypothetical protein
VGTGFPATEFFNYFRAVGQGRSSQPPINKRLKALSLAAPVTKSFFIRQLFILGTGLAVNYGGHFFHWAASLTRLIVFTFLPFKADSF